MRAVLQSAWTLGLSAALVACSTRAPDAQDLRGAAGDYVERIDGRVTAYDVATDVPRIFTRYGFAIERAERSERHFEVTTLWRDRDPFADEEVRDFSAVRTRFRLEGHRHGEMYSMRLHAESMGLVPGSGWRTMNATPKFKAYVREVAREMHLTLATGIREY